MFGIKTRLINSVKAFKYVKKNCNTTHSAILDALLLCHALEKGMGTQRVKHGFGKEKAEKLTKLLIDMQKVGTTNSFAFQESLAILNAYIQFQKSDGIELKELEEQVVILNKSLDNSCDGGFYMGGDIEFLVGTSIDYPSFVKSRHSMRTYSSATVTNEEIQKAIELAKRAPSACNRQPWHVYYSFDKEKINVIRNSVPPQAFLQDTPYFCVITVEKSLFGSTEINQWFINGGIFTSFFILALHYLGIGSVILQYTMFNNTEKKLRNVLDIKEKDEIIAVIGYGKYPSEAKCICAQRRPNEEIAILR